MSVVELYEDAIKWHDDVWLRVMTQVPDKEAAIALLGGLDAYGMLIFEVWRPLFLEVFGINARDRRGRKHGPWKDWWSPGIVLRTECRYHKGLHREGQYTLYDEGGDLEIRGHRRDYQREGFWEEWDRGKCRMITGKYRNNVRAGTWYTTVRNSRKMGKMGRVFAIYNDPPTPDPYYMPSVTRTHAGFRPTPDLPVPGRLANVKTTSYKSGGATWFYLFIRAHATNSRH